MTEDKIIKYAKINADRIGKKLMHPDGTLRKNSIVMESVEGSSIKFAIGDNEYYVLIKEYRIIEGKITFRINRRLFNNELFENGED